MKPRTLLLRKSAAEFGPITCRKARDRRTKKELHSKVVTDA